MQNRFSTAPRLVRAKKQRVSRNDNIDWSQPARIVKIEAATPNNPARKNWPRSVAAEIGRERLPGITNTILSEDCAEPRAIRMAWAFMRPTTMIPQPETVFIEIDGHIIEHIPDFLLTFDSSELRLEVKGAASFTYSPVTAKRLAALAIAYENIGLKYEVARSDHIRNTTGARNAEFIYRARHRFVSDECRDILHEQIYGRNSCTIGQLVEVAAQHSCFASSFRTFPHPTKSPDFLKRDLARLHADGEVTIDLGNGEFNPSTTVRAGIVRQSPAWFRLPWTMPTFPTLEETVTIGVKS